MATVTFSRPMSAKSWLEASNPSERWKWDFMYQDLPPIKFGDDFGPQPRDYSYQVPKKVARAALCSALSTRVAAGHCVVVDKFAFAQPKTKEALAIFGRLKAQKPLVVSATEDAGLHLSVRNLKDAKYIRAEGVNVFDVLKYDTLVLTVEAARALENRLG